MKFKPFIINSKSTDVDWVSIFLLSEFRQYLRFDHLLTLSTLSSTTRSALKKLIFKKLKFSGRKYKKFESYFTLPYSNNNLFSEYFKFYDELFDNRRTIDVKPYTSLDLQIDLKVLIFSIDIGVCVEFVNELKLYDLFTVGYYILPAFIQFQNLRSLNLRDCSVFYRTWCVMHYNLICLTSLKITRVTFIVSTVEEFDQSKIILGNHLRKFDVHYCSYWVTDLPDEDTKFIFNTIEDIYRHSIKLPLICIPTLKEFTLSIYKVKNHWLSGFLIINPQLTALTIDHTEIDEFTLITLAKYSNLTDLSIRCWGFRILNDPILEFPKITSIKTLNIEYLCESSCDFINNIIFSCVNLNSLNYSLSVFSETQTVMSYFYMNTVPKLQNLKIDSGFGEIMDLDLKNFISVEHLEVRNCGQIIVKLELPSYPTLLKKLTIYYKERNFKVGYIKKKFEKFINWKCKFKKDKITCFKI